MAPRTKLRVQIPTPRHGIPLRVARSKPRNNIIFFGANAFEYCLQTKVWKQLNILASQQPAREARNLSAKQ